MELTKSTDAVRGRMRAALGGFSEEQALVIGVVTAGISLLAIIVFGVISFASLLTVAVVYLTARELRGRARYWIYGAAAVGYLVIAEVAAFGALDPSVSRLALEAQAPVSWIIISVIYEAALGFAVWKGSRRASTPIAATPMYTTSGRCRLGPHTGRIVGGYQVSDCIGTGGVGRVYRAYRISDGATVAIKISHRPTNPGAVEGRRFEREVETLERLRSPNVVEVRDAGLTDDGHHFIAMELLEGRDLGSLLSRAAMPLLGVARMVEDVAAGLAMAHRIGVVHRDVKPSNIFLARSQRGDHWKLLDFGLSKNYGVHSCVTKGYAVGTPGFMSPEQVLGEPLDHRSDVFALAAVAYAALTRTVPFVAADPVTTTQRVVSSMPLAPRARADVPPDVELVLALGLAKHVADRPHDIEAFADAFRAACRGQLDEQIRHAAHRVLRVHPWASQDEIDTELQTTKRRRPPVTRRELASTCG
jgi:hypothetical protein